MRNTGIIVGLVGGLLFVWHLGKVFAGTDAGAPPFTHHVVSLIGGVMLFAGIWLYVAGRKRGRRGPGTHTTS